MLEMLKVCKKKKKKKFADKIIYLADYFPAFNCQITPTNFWYEHRRNIPLYLEDKKHTKTIIN